MKSRKSRNFLGARKHILILIAGLLILSTGVWAITAYNQPAKSGDKTPEGGSSVNLNSPAEEEKNSAQDNPAAQTGTKKKVSPIITSADKQSVYAYVPDIIEDGGTCTATFSYGQDKVTASSQAFSNVSYTSCKRIALDSPLTISGTWSVVVSYSSATAEGKSPAFEVH